MSGEESAPLVGGGIKKVLYTLQVAQAAGWRPTAKALSANNACKACGLGMGGQRGGMTNELGEFPAVCNKSVQAQSSDLQAPIPAEIFQHSIRELAELDEREMNLLGRLNFPLMKGAEDERFRVADWNEALGAIAARMRITDPARSFFYSSGRSSNEAGFILQLLARLYGTNSVNNCSYYCHQATSEALQSTIGTGTATVELADLSGCDLVFVVGANPASNHPRLIHQLKACRDRGGEVIVINPAREPGLVRFAVPKSPASLISGGSEIASLYLQPKIGGDIAVFKGIAKALLAMRGQDDGFIATHTAGFDAYRQDIEATAWSEICAAAGIDRQQIERLAATYAKAGATVFAWGMGLTHHRHGVDNIEQLANLALLRGMVGRRFAGLLPLRGHSNVQGIGTIGVKPVLSEQIFDALERELGVALPRKPGLDTMAAMQAAHRGEIDFAMMVGGNLYAANPNSQWAAEALNRIPGKVFLTTTLNRGHVCGAEDGDVIVLPVTARDEEWQPTTQESMFNYVRLSDGGIVRLNGVRPESDILCDLAERVIDRARFDFGQFRAHKTVRQSIAAIIPGMEALRDIDVAKQEFHVRRRVLHQPEFHTVDGRCHFRVASLPSLSDELFRFTLATVRSEGQFNSIVYEEADSYRGVNDRHSVMMNREDMADLELERGAKVTLRSADGVMSDVAVVPFDLPRGNLLAYYPEANVLTGQAVDERSRTPAFKSVPVAVVRDGTESPVPLPALRRS